MATNKNSGTSTGTNANTGAEIQNAQAAEDAKAAKSVDSNKTANKDTYIVKDGDTLDSVAQENGMEAVELMRLNPELEASGSNNNMLYTGQEIRLK